VRASTAPPLGQRGPRKRVVVLGAGVAGLAAAFELDAAGHEVTVLEARFWRAAGMSGFADTDLPVPEVWDLSEGQPGQRGLLMAYLTGPFGDEVARRTPDDRLNWTLDHMERIFPGTRLEYEGGASYAWGEDPWSRGACPMYGPGQVIDLFPAVRQAEGRLHFAGDHASVWPGWIQGALESANRAARAIDATPE
jgi:monoamine oxidase